MYIQRLLLSITPCNEAWPEVELATRADHVETSHVPAHEHCVSPNARCIPTFRVCTLRPDDVLRRVVADTPYDQTSL
jgi:hypothetical protein